MAEKKLRTCRKQDQVTFDTPAPQYEEVDPSGKTEDGSNKPSFKRNPIQVLSGQQAETYCKLVEGLIRGGKPNNSYPSGRGVANLIYLLRPSTNRGLSDQVRVNLNNGLPDEPDIGRVIADKDICERLLRSHDMATVRDRTDDASRRLVSRLDYYQDCLLYTSPSPRDRTRSRMPSSA